MKRGDVVLAAVSGDYGKPRPYLVVQTDKLDRTHPSILLCPITSTLDDSLFRIALPADVQTGLRKPSQVMADKVQAIRRERIGAVIGRVDAYVLQRANRVLAIMLGLAESEGVLSG